MIERIVATRDVLAQHVRARLERDVRAAIEARGMCSLAIPGGSVAHTFLPALVDADVPWASVDLFWCDERVVAADSPDSNWALAWQLWLRHLSPRNRPRIHRMPVDTHPPERAAASYERELREVLRSRGERGDAGAAWARAGALDLVLLGLGPDGHVASLFPGHWAATSDDVRAVVVVHGAPKPPPVRLTLTMRMLAHASVLVLAAFGAEKAAIVRDVLGNDASTVPAAVLLRQRSSPSVILLDAEAAALLSPAP